MSDASRERLPVRDVIRVSRRAGALESAVWVSTTDAMPSSLPETGAPLPADPDDPAPTCVGDIGSPPTPPRDHPEPDKGDYHQ